MTQTLQNMSQLYARLDQIGLPKKFVRDKALPDWWCDEFEQTPSAVTEAALYVSHRLNLNLQSLLEETAQPEFVLTCQPKFYAQSNNPSLKIATALATQIAKLVAQGCPNDYQSICNLSRSEIRQIILQTQNCVNLIGLLDFCWDRGIPVVHYNNYPKTVCKFHGMVAVVADRPVIMISLNHASPARLAFIIAHELGHIYHQHLPEGGLLVDEEISLESIDEEEIEANEFAGELLLGRPDVSYYTPHKFSGNRLASYAKRIAERDSVDAGVVIWNYAWTKKEWAVAQNALKVVEGASKANEIIDRYLQNRLDWERLSDDNQDYLSLMLRLD